MRLGRDFASQTPHPICQLLAFPTPVTPSGPSPTAGAVFLSYAREDAEAARRIADALRAFGMEVWFDQNELRGGDSWDAKIRKQIKECALFMPVVSAHTQERGEGYFRREWKLAVERTGDMAAGIAFVLPVVIDLTTEADALVPEEFMRVQWTRLSGALPSAEFVAQVKRLLEAPRKPAGPTRSASLPAASEPGLAGLEPNLRADIKRDPGDHGAWMRLGGVLAMLGQKDEALRSARRAVELTPETHDRIYAAGRRAGLAFVQTWTGERDAAITAYAALLCQAGSLMFDDNPELNVHVMKVDPCFAPLRNDPRFEALLNDPKNNAPLF